MGAPQDKRRDYKENTNDRNKKSKSHRDRQKVKSQHIASRNDYKDQKKHYNKSFDYGSRADNYYYDLTVPQDFNGKYKDKDQR